MDGWGWLIILLAILLGVSARRNFVIRKQLRALQYCIQGRRSFLSDGSFETGFYHPVKELADHLNNLMEEFNNLLEREKVFSRQIEITMSSMQEGVLFLDENNRIVFSNSAFKRIFPSVNIDGKPRIELFFESSRFLDTIQSIRLGKLGNPVELPLLKAPELRWINLYGSTIRKLSDREGVLTILILQDVTRQKRLEEAREEFVGNVAHELKTPITIIKGFAETLEEDGQEMPWKQQKDFIGKIQRNSDRMSRLVEDLLMISLLDAKETELNLQPVAIQGLLESIFRIYGERALAANKTLILKGPVPGGFIRGDEGLLQQVFSNLLDNALKYTPDGARIELGANQEAHLIRFWVADDGHGIPEADLQHIFERFYRVDKARSRLKGGTGLGLSIALRVIQRHGGTISAANAENGGLRVSFTLKLAA